MNRFFRCFWVLATILLLFLIHNSVDTMGQIPTQSPSYMKKFHQNIYLTSEKTEFPFLNQPCFSLRNFTNSETDTVNVKRNFFYDVYGAVKILALDAWYVTSSPARINLKSALWLSGLTLTSAVIYANDQQILDAVQRSGDNKFLKPFYKIGYTFEPLGYQGNTNKYYFAALGIGYFFKVEWLQNISAQILEANFIASGFKNIAGILVGRARPYEGKGPYDFEFNKGTSFPSGHAVVIFNLATILSYHVNHWPFTIAAFGTAAAVGVQRIDSKGHWPSDVFAGAVLGTAVSFAVLKLHEKRKIKMQPTYLQESKTFGFKISVPLFPK